MKTISIRGRRTGAVMLAIAALSLAFPLSEAASAATLPTLDVEPELQTVNEGETVILTATLADLAPQEVNIDWEAESGPNSVFGDEDAGPAASDRTDPDRECNIPPGGLTCSIEYTARLGHAGQDVWRAWIDLDHSADVLGESDNTDDSDQQENQQGGGGPPGQPARSSNPLSDDMCATSGTTEPDCTDVVAVNIGGMEIAPDTQTLDGGQTTQLIARVVAPVQSAEGINIDFENESGSNDTDGTTRSTPDLTCTIPQGGRECFVEYTGVRGSDTWRGWIDLDNTQSTFNGDSGETRWSSESGGDPGPDCQQPEDQGQSPPCHPPSNQRGSHSSGGGCLDPNDPEANPADVEPDCTDVIQRVWRAGPVARIDCDDRAGTQGQDTERETNPQGEAEEYRCSATDQFGSPINGVVIKGEVTTGVNDPDTPDSESYQFPDYQCTTQTFFLDPLEEIEVERGACYEEVEAFDNELGTAEVCWWTGTAAEGATLCGDEPTGEDQQANGEDAGNDLADRTEKRWENPATFRLNCEPETDTNPAGAEHTITCTATSATGATVSDVNVDANATGDNDPSPPVNPQGTPDFTCTTGDDGSCSFPHQGSDEGETTYRAWIDADGTDSTNESDATEGRDENTTPGVRPEPDNTDVVQKTWGPPPATVTVTPETDTAPVGECNPYTITLTDDEGRPVPGAIVDAEQRHERASNQTQNDEPTVSFCEPPASGGPNPSNVDESRGDLGSGEGQENPNNPGTAGGETTQQTDQNGKVTIGIRVAPGNGSNGSGGVALSVWWEGEDNDDPDTGDPQDSATKSWTPSGGEPGVPAGASLEPPSSNNEPGDAQTYTVTVSDGNGDPVEGAAVTWSEEGTGDFVSQENTTDSNGQASAQVTSNVEGTQTIRVTVADCAEGATCEDSATQVWEEQRPESCPGHANDDRNQIVGTPGNDVLEGTDEDDVICGLGGKDTLIGRGGEDLLLGGNGNDILRGNAAGDRLNGGKGEDTLQGGGGGDRLIGGADDDILRGGGGNDTLLGRGGKDVLRGRGGNDVLKGNAGNDNLNGGRGRDTLNGGKGRDTCIAGDGRDRLRNCE